MKQIDVFNGDADGLCALAQLRRAYPVNATLVTGVKRDIQLLKRIDAELVADSKITVLDISYEKNAEDVQHLLQLGAGIDYYDHHKTGKLLKHAHLKLNINISADVCTALIVNQTLAGRYQAWAITGAFGDNLLAVASQLAQQADYTKQQVAKMSTLGQLLNYNAYGDAISDLFYDPAKLFDAIRHYDDPFAFMAENKVIVDTLSNGYKEDLELAQAAQVISDTPFSAVYMLPDERWARRVSGVFGNYLANNAPDKAHAVIRKTSHNAYLVSIRAPLLNKQGADVVASQFPTGGGRKAAAGINALSENNLSVFCQTLDYYYSSS